MDTTSPAEAAINILLRNGTLSSGRISVGPIGPKALLLLEVLWSNRSELKGKRGGEQVADLRNAYIAAKAKHAAADEQEGHFPPPGEEGEPRPAPTLIHETPKGGWRLHRLRCKSIRGIASLGKVFDFTFDGMPLLVYGPNGSGKSSLLNAVSWVLTGVIVTDCEADASEIALYSPPKEKGRPPKIRDWPAVHTLPHEGDPKEFDLDCWAEILLVSAEDSKTLHLRRSLGGHLEESVDAITWKPCPSLTAHGITALDLQLSVSAATVFGRRNIEASDDTRHLLSMMLGYDLLEDMGSLITTLAANLTKTSNTEKDTLASRRDRLRGKLATMSSLLRDGLPLKDALNGLTGAELPTAESISEVVRFAETRVQESERELAVILGLGDVGSPALSGLADALTAAVAMLNRPCRDLFAEITCLLPPGVEASHSTENLEPFVELNEQLLQTFEASAAERIKERYALWQMESTTQSKTALLLQAAAFFDVAAHQCPVCDQSIHGMPIESELQRFKDSPEYLRSNLRQFFLDLTDELNKEFGVVVQRIGTKPPAQRILEDWQRLRSSAGKPINAIVDGYNLSVTSVIAEFEPVSVSNDDLLPDNADAAFRTAAESFVATITAVRTVFALARWGNKYVPLVLERLASILTEMGGDETTSLAATLSRGKHAAADVAPVVALRGDLAAAAVEAMSINEGEILRAAIDEIHTALQEIKPIGKYAASEVERVFDTIKDKTIENYKKLYPYSSPNLIPSRIHINKGRDQTVEAYLAGSGYEVPGQHVANAGLLRAIALAFYFAILERHPGGLNFIIMDDPILSLDDDHRESWSANILRPTLSQIQVIVATHQRQFLNNCGVDFHPGRLIELNPRSRGRDITWRPGDRLDRAEELLDSAWTSVATEMRKYREDVLITLDAYSPVPFFIASNLRNSLDAYVGLVAPNPLAHKAQQQIAGNLKDDRVVRVLDPGSHSMTEADVTRPMVEECLKLLRRLDEIFRSEVKRLEALRIRNLRSKGITTQQPDPMTAVTSVTGTVTGGVAKLLPVMSTERLRVGDEEAAWDAPIRVMVVGMAAAKSSNCVVDICESPLACEFPPGGVVQVASDSLAPIARSGQWALLSEEVDDVKDGDLAAVKDRLGNQYLRRIWSNGDGWVLESVNPLAGVSPKRVRRCECLVKKIIGVSYGPSKAPNASRSDKIREWLPRRDFPHHSLSELFGVTIKGTSLEPIACNGQIVLVSKRISGKLEHVRSGSLAVVETDDDSVGHVIKRIYPQDKYWLMLSPNYIETHLPLTVSRQKIRAVWPVQGVLFASSPIE